MRRVYQGIYIKEMTLFKGETLEYQIYERRESGAVLVKEGRAVCDLKSEGKDNSRFACLNQMSEALAQQDADGLLKAMEDYVKKSMVLGFISGEIRTSPLQFNCNTLSDREDKMH